MPGGEPKAFEKRDKESLQAKWATIEEIKSGRKEFPLRYVKLYFIHSSILFVHMNRDCYFEEFDITS